jgi:hypothetical protein
LVAGCRERLRHPALSEEIDVLKKTSVTGILVAAAAGTVLLGSGSAAHADGWGCEHGHHNWNHSRNHNRNHDRIFIHIRVVNNNVNENAGERRRGRLFSTGNNDFIDGSGFGD